MNYLVKASLHPIFQWYQDTVCKYIAEYYNFPASSGINYYLILRGPVPYDDNAYSSRLKKDIVT